ncbi:MAG: hypothetical protein M0O92_05495 [Acholeplasmataceae bacterium]|nr:hypothetical protein [Acholeplasmataceae bacterium]
MFKNFLNKMFFWLNSLMFLVPHDYATVPKSSGSLTSGGNTNLIQHLVDRNLREDVTLNDIWNRLKVSIDIRDTRIEIPQAVFMQFMTPPSGTRSVTIPMVAPYKEAFQEGTDEEMLGEEEDTEIYNLQLWHNEIKKSVSMRGWGIDYEELNSLGVYQTITPRLAKAWQEYRGKRIRTSLMLTHEDALTKSPIGLKQEFNSNIFIPNLPLGSMPRWDRSDIDDATYTLGYADSLGFQSKEFSGDYIDLIAEQMLTASGTSDESQAYMLVDNLNDLEHYCRNYLKLREMRIGDSSGYIFICPQEVLYYLLNPNISGTLGSLWKDVTCLSKEEASYPGMVGKYRHLWIVGDERAPTLTLSGSEDSYTLEPGFVNPGNNDDRNLSPWSGTSSYYENYVFDVGTVLGAGSIAEWVVYEPKYAKESTQYGKHMGKGSYMMGGISAARFGKDDTFDSTYNTTGDNTLINRGSCMVLMSRRQISHLRSTTTT